MKEKEIYKDILQYRISSQTFYNDNLITVRNPEIRQLFTQLRDDEMRDVVKLQQKIDRLEASPGIVSRIFPSKPRY
jgi:rubrerythrin